MRIGILLVVCHLYFVGLANADFTRPNPGEGPTEVRVQFGLLDIDDVDGVSQTFTANLFMKSSWKDPRLAHDGEGNVSHPLSEVWHPRFQFVNQQRLHRTFAEVIEASPEGDVVYRQRVWGAFSQPLDLHEFPFDTQKLEITVVSSGYTTDEIVLLDDPKSPSIIAESFSLPDWIIEEWHVETGSFALTKSMAGLSSISIAVQATREVGYYIIKVIFPLGLVVAMSWVVFWIDPGQYGTQIGVATTSMLTLIAYRLSLDAVLPKVSYLTRMDRFILVATVVVFLTLLQAVLTAVLARNDRVELAESIDRKCRIIFPLALLLLWVPAFLH